MQVFGLELLGRRSNWRPGIVAEWMPSGFKVREPVTPPIGGRQAAAALGEVTERDWQKVKASFICANAASSPTHER
jgi:hypothetical protein